MSDMNEAAPALLAKVPIALRWRDLDAFNHVNNATFLTYIEEARLRWFSGIEGVWLDDQVAPILAATHMNYRRQLSWPGDIVVELYCTRVGNSSLTIGHRIVDAKDETIVYADGEAVLVWIRPETGRPVPLPDAVRAAAQSPA